MRLCSRRVEFQCASQRLQCMWHRRVWRETSCVSGLKREQDVSVCQPGVGECKPVVACESAIEQLYGLTAARLRPSAPEETAPQVQLIGLWIAGVMLFQGRPLIAPER